MNFPPGLTRISIRRLTLSRRVACLLLSTVLLVLLVSGCDFLSTPEAPQPTDTPQRPASTPVSATLPPTPEPQTPSAEGLLLAVTVASVNANRPDYDRSEWRHWIDEDRDCQNARQEVLIEESSTPAVLDPDNECRVLSGSWVGPYTGQMVNDPTELDIDHMVPLENAHRSGAWSWDRDRKREYANFLGYEDHLIATTSRANRSKGSKGPEEWRPPSGELLVRLCFGLDSHQEQLGPDGIRAGILGPAGDARHLPHTSAASAFRGGAVRG